MNPYNVSRIIYISILMPIYVTQFNSTEFNSIEVNSTEFEHSLNAVKYDDLALKKCKHSYSFPWTIHGWWPEYSRGKWPQFCDPKRYREFTEEAIEPIRSKMDVYWSSCPGYPSAFNLWKHEWEKHGTCVPNVSVIDYFNHTINAFLEADANNFYECCDSLKSQCMLPFAMPINQTKWLGYCYKDYFDPIISQ